MFREVGDRSTKYTFVRVFRGCYVGDAKYKRKDLCHEGSFHPLNIFYDSRLIMRKKNDFIRNGCEL